MSSSFTERHWPRIQARAEAFWRALPKRARPEVAVAAALAMLLGMNALRLRLAEAARRSEAEAAALELRLAEAEEALGATASLAEMKSKDLALFRSALSRLTESRRALYEGGLALQEEKRLLEKQWEIMTTYLKVDSEAGKVHLMRGEQSLESYAVLYATAQAFGVASSSGVAVSTAPAPVLRAPPPVTTIVSKERFAHPERGKSEQVDGQLQWEPPQVGDSVRANALGEYVMFTRGSLVLHGPPKRPKEHAAFPHYCLGLSWAIARRLYGNSFIGTKILFKPAVPASGKR